jgi:hypothetical protein
VLLLLAESLVRGRAGRAWVAIRQNCSRAFEIDRSFQISMRKEVLRAAALTTLKLPLSHCIFRPVANSEQTGEVDNG